MTLLASTGAGDGPLTFIELALVIFLAVFVLVTLGAVLRRAGHYDRVARIPLNDDPETLMTGPDQESSR